MSTKDYKKGLDGRKPGFVDGIFNDRAAIRDQKRGHQDHLKNVDLERRIVKSKKGEESYDREDRGCRLEKGFFELSWGEMFLAIVFMFTVGPVLLFLLFLFLLIIIGVVLECFDVNFFGWLNNLFNLI